MKISRLSVVVSTLLIASMIAPFQAYAGPKEDAQAVFEKFLAAFSAGDVDGVLNLFAPDALVWGTLMTDLATTPPAVREYFKGVGTRTVKASVFGNPSALVLSDNAVLLSGMWQFERVVDGKLTQQGPFRVSIAAVKRGDRWLIAQFHNSPRPNPPTPQ